MGLQGSLPSCRHMPSCRVVSHFTVSYRVSTKPDVGHGSEWPIFDDHLCGRTVFSAFECVTRSCDIAPLYDACSVSPAGQLPCWTVDSSACIRDRSRTSLLNRSRTRTPPASLMRAARSLSMSRWRNAWHVSATDARCARQQPPQEASAHPRFSFHSYARKYHTSMQQSGGDVVVMR